jgi:esterase/lipase
MRYRTLERRKLESILDAAVSLGGLLGLALTINFL